MHCQNCGKVSTHQSNFCRFCGTKFATVQYSQPNNYNPVPNPAPVNYENMQRRPYSWKTDEYQIPSEKSKTQPIDQVPPLPSFQPPTANTSVQPFQPAQPVNANFGCPRCASKILPQLMRQISTAGWITFGVLLVTPFFFLFWIGLLIKEDVRVCPVCKFKYQ